VTAITDLEIFARVARTGNMSAAGREMGLSPAVVSKRVSLLEERLGTRLFQRTTRQLTLTETGEGYFKRVVDILSLIAEAEDFVSRRNTKPRGVLKVTAPTAFSRLHIAPYLPQFLAKYPEIELDFHLTDNYVDIIREGFDLAVRIGELRDSSLVQRKLAGDRRVICAASKYIEKFGAPANLADLDFHNCLSAGAQDYWRLQGPDGQHQLKVKGNIRSNSLEFVREALLAGLGIGLRSTWDVGPELESGALKVLLPQYCGADGVAIHAVYPCRDFMPEKVNVFIEFLSDIYGPEPYWNQNPTLDRLLNPCLAPGASPKKEAHATAPQQKRKAVPPARHPDGRPS
jgi:DNA-binding transcriptional LysR family regulator